MLFMCNIIEMLYGDFIMWIIKHIVCIYVSEITLAAVLCVYGIVSEDGFGACGY